MNIVELTEIRCATCDMLFGVPETFADKRRKSHDTFYCPCGHAQSYTRKDDEPTKERLEGLRKEIRELKCENIGLLNKNEELLRQKPRWFFQK